MYYINYFLVLSIFGHLIESIFFYDGYSGILYGWWTPIYGIGSVIILFIHKLIDKLKFNKFFKAIILFIACSIILSIIEVIGGYFIEEVLRKEMWNYTSLRFNIGKYASLEMALVWGISSLVLIYLIKPIFDKFIKKIPKFISYVLITLFFIDLVATIVFKS